MDGPRSALVKRKDRRTLLIIDTDRTSEESTLICTNLRNRPNRTFCTHQYFVLRKNQYFLLRDPNSDKHQLQPPIPPQLLLPRLHRLSH